MYICREVNFGGVRRCFYHAILQNKYNYVIQLNCYMQLNALDKPILWFAFNSSQIIKIYWWFKTGVFKQFWYVLSSKFCMRFALRTGEIKNWNARNEQFESHSVCVSGKLMNSRHSSMSHSGLSDASIQSRSSSEKVVPPGHVTLTNSPLSHIV